MPVSASDHLKKRAHLAPARIERLLTGDWRTSGVFRLNQDLTADDLSASTVFVNARRLLAIVQRDAGAPIGPNGRFTYEYRRMIARELWWAPSGEPPPDDEILGEIVRPIELTQSALEVAGLLVPSGDHLLVTAEAERLLARECGGELFARLFRAYFADLDHSRIDHEPTIPNAWRYVPYAMHVVGRMDDRWYDIDAVFQNLLPDEVVRAENQRLRSISRRGRVTPSVLLLFLIRFLDLLPDFALLATQPTVEGVRGYPYPVYQRGPLYERVVRFVW